MSQPHVSSQKTVPSRWRPALEGPGLIDLRLPIVPKVRASDPRVAQMRDALMEGDPLAEALLEWMGRAPERRALFERALSGGIASVPQASPSLAAFFEDLEREPAWLDREAVRLGTETMARVGAGGYAALGSVSLMSGYLASAAVKPLAMTGALTRMARRRLAETSRFVLDVSTSGDFARGSAGFVSAVRVRVIHATIRRALRASPDWRTEQWGEPINQHDMVATNLQFSSVYVLGLLAQGYLVTRREREAVMHLWRWVGHVSGIRDALLPRTFKEGLELGFLINRTEEGPDDDSRALAAALMEATRALHVEGLGPRLGGLKSRVELGLSRFVLGDRAADALGLPDDAFKYAPLVLGPPTMAAEIVRRVVPGARAFSIRFGTRVVRDALDRVLEGTPPPFAVAT
ncbi:MAG: DUF2236 domain-containing protein [Deltaproteobacteria bacterium]|nr:DUF2236 domain-containing protein [Deltaproteobacteria bacterium]